MHYTTILFVSLFTFVPQSTLCAAALSEDATHSISAENYITKRLLDEQSVYHTIQRFISIDCTKQEFDTGVTLFNQNHLLVNFSQNRYLLGTRWPFMPAPFDSYLIHGYSSATNNNDQKCTISALYTMIKKRYTTIFNHQKIWWTGPYIITIPPQEHYPLCRTYEMFPSHQDYNKHLIHICNTTSSVDQTRAIITPIVHDDVPVTPANFIACNKSYVLLCNHLLETHAAKAILSPQAMFGNNLSGGSTILRPSLFLLSLNIPAVYNPIDSAPQLAPLIINYIQSEAILRNHAQEIASLLIALDAKRHVPIADSIHYMISDIAEDRTMKLLARKIAAIAPFSNTIRTILYKIYDTALINIKETYSDNHRYIWEKLNIECTIEPNTARLFRIYLSDDILQNPRSGASVLLHHCVTQQYSQANQNNRLLSLPNDAIIRILTFVGRSQRPPARWVLRHDYSIAHLKNAAYILDSGRYHYRDKFLYAIRTMPKTTTARLILDALYAIENSLLKYPNKTLLEKIAALNASFAQLIDMQHYTTETPRLCIPLMKHIDQYMALNRDNIAVATLKKELQTLLNTNISTTKACKRLFIMSDALKRAVALDAHTVIDQCPIMKLIKKEKEPSYVKKFLHYYNATLHLQESLRTKISSLLYGRLPL